MGRVGHKMEDKGIFIHQARVSIKGIHRENFPIIAERVPFFEDVYQNLLVASAGVKRGCIVIFAKTPPFGEDIQGILVVTKDYDAAIKLGTFC